MSADDLRAEKAGHANWSDFYQRYQGDSVSRAEFRKSRRRSLEVGVTSVKEASHYPPLPHYTLRAHTGKTAMPFEVDYGAGWIRREPGTIALIPPFVDCRIRGNPCAQVDTLLATFSEADLQDVAGELVESKSHSLKRPPRREFQEPMLFSLLTQLWGQSHANSLGEDLLVEGTFVSMIGRLLMISGEKLPELPQTDRGSAAIVRKARDYMQSNFESKLSLAEIATAAGVSRPYLTRVFRNATDRTVHEHLLEIRVERAKELMRYFGRNMTLAEIAVQCGFSNHGHLTLAFRQVTGVTPQQYRQES